MNTYISLLRGINVSGHNIIKMDALKKMYVKLGFRNVKTYLQSGNVIFQSSEKKFKRLQQLISSQIEEEFALHIPVQVITIDKLEQIVKNNSLLKDPSVDILFLHVTFLESRPENYEIESINCRKSNGEEIIITDSAAYLYCPGGYGKTKLSNTFLESKLKVTATTRNWKTVNELLSIANSL